MQRKYILSEAKEISSSPNRLQCSVCKKQFWMTFKYLEHMASHNLLVLSCNICCKGFYDEELLDQHYLIHDDNIKPYNCKLCPEMFIYKHKLEQHMQCHVPASKAFFENINRKPVHLKNGSLESKNISDNYFSNKEDSVENETKIKRRSRSVKRTKLFGDETYKCRGSAEKQLNFNKSTDKNVLLPEAADFTGESDESGSITKKLCVMAPKISDELLKQLKERKGTCMLKDFKDSSLGNKKQFLPSSVKTAQSCGNDTNAISNNNAAADRKLVPCKALVDTKKILYVGSMKPNIETIQTLIQRVESMPKTSVSSSNAGYSLKKPVSSNTTTPNDQIPAKVAKIHDLNSDSRIIDKMVVDNFLLVKVTQEYMEEMKKQKMYLLGESHSNTALLVETNVDSHSQMSCKFDIKEKDNQTGRDLITESAMQETLSKSSNNNNVSSNSSTQLVENSVSNNLNNEPSCSKHDGEISPKSAPVVVKIPIEESVQNGKKYFAVSKAEISGNPKVCENMTVNYNVETTHEYSTAVKNVFLQSNDAETTDECSTSVKNALLQSNDAEKNKSAIIIENKAISIAKTNIEKTDKNVTGSSEVSEIGMNNSIIKNNKSSKQDVNSTIQSNIDLTKYGNSVRSEESNAKKNKRTGIVKNSSMKNENDTETTSQTKIINCLEEMQSDNSKQDSVVEPGNTSIKNNISISDLDQNCSIKIALNFKNRDNNANDIIRTDTYKTFQEKSGTKCHKHPSTKKGIILPVGCSTQEVKNKDSLINMSNDTFNLKSNSEEINQSLPKCKSVSVIENITNSQRSEKHSSVHVARKRKSKIKKISEEIRNTIDTVCNANIMFDEFSIEKKKESNVFSKVSNNTQTDLKILSCLDSTADYINKEHNTEKKIDLTVCENSDTDIEVYTNILSSLNVDRSQVKNSNILGGLCPILTEKDRTDTEKQFDSSTTNFTELAKKNKGCFVFSNNIIFPRNNLENSKQLKTSTTKLINRSRIPSSSNALEASFKSNTVSINPCIIENRRPTKYSDEIPNFESLSVSRQVTVKQKDEFNSVICSTLITNPLSNSESKTVKDKNFKDVNNEVSAFNKSTDTESVNSPFADSTAHKNKKHKKNICKSGVSKQSKEDFYQQKKKRSVDSECFIGKSSEKGKIKLKPVFLENSQQNKNCKEGKTKDNIYNMLSIDSNEPQIQLTERILELYKAKMEEKERKKKEKYELKKKQRFKESQLKSSDDSINVTGNTKELCEASEKIPINQQKQNVAEKSESKGSKDLIQVTKYELKRKEYSKDSTSSLSQYLNISVNQGNKLVKPNSTKDSNSPQNVKYSRVAEKEDKSIRMSEKEAIEKVYEISLNFEKPVEEAECLSYLSKLEEIISVYNIGSKCSFIFKALGFCRLHVDSYEVKERAISLHQMITRSIKKP